mmetsp:Transcript_34042/g.68743  ORF Transcript_34042/g.68743 Transcript_34042/m.68743 type:complete len:282 (-) Transcript_34042:204-1049(-)
MTSSLKQCSIASIGISTPGSPRTRYAMRRFRSAWMISGATCMKGLHSMKPSSFSWADVRSKCMSHSSRPKPGSVAPSKRATSWWGNSPAPSSSAASKTLANNSERLVRGGTMSQARPAAFNASLIAWAISRSSCDTFSSCSTLTLCRGASASCCSSDSELSACSTTLSSWVHVGGGGSLDSSNGVTRLIPRARTVSFSRTYESKYFSNTPSRREPSCWPCVMKRRPSSLLPKAHSCRRSPSSKRNRRRGLAAEPPATSAKRTTMTTLGTGASLVGQLKRHS